MRLKFLFTLVPGMIYVNISSDPVGPVLPFGSAVTLTCTVELSPAGYVPVTVNTVWTGPDGFMTNTSTAQPVMGSNTAYTSVVVVSSFGRNQSGNYTCTATVSSTTPFLLSSTQSATKNLLSGVDPDATSVPLQYDPTSSTKPVESNTAQTPVIAGSIGAVLLLITICFVATLVLFLLRYKISIILVNKTIVYITIIITEADDDIDLVSIEVQYSHLNSSSQNYCIYRVYITIILQKQKEKGTCTPNAVQLS